MTSTVFDDFGTTEWIIVFIPIVTSFTNYFCRVAERGSVGPTYRVTPPGWVFSIVWPILYLFIGFAWAIAGTEPLTITLYISLLVCLMSWAPLFNLSYQYGLYCIHVCILAAILVYTESPRESKLFLTPLLTWLMFASKLNYTLAL